MTLDEARKLVEDFFQDKEKANLWFRTPNPLLGNISPDTMIALGKADKLARLIEDLHGENFRDG